MLNVSTFSLRLYLRTHLAWAKSENSNLKSRHAWKLLLWDYLLDVMDKTRDLSTIEFNVPRLLWATLIDHFHNDLTLLWGRIKARLLMFQLESVNRNLCEIPNIFEKG